MTPPWSRYRESGFALLIVLWTLVLIALIVTHMVTAARQETQLASNLRRAAELGAAADGAVFQAVFHVLDKSPFRWPADRAIRRIAIPGGFAEIRIGSEAGKVNLNTAQADILTALLRETGVGPEAADAIANAIIVWRTPSGEAQSMAAAYRQAGFGYEPPAAPFESVDELGHVLGVTPAILSRVAPHLTIYYDGDPDPAVADPAVLRAIRDVKGTIPASSRAGPDESVIDIEVRAVGGGEAFRRAIVRLGPTASGKLFDVLMWNGGSP